MHLTTTQTQLPILLYEEKSNTETFEMQPGSRIYTGRMSECLSVLSLPACSPCTAAAINMIGMLTPEMSANCAKSFMPRFKAKEHLKRHFRHMLDCLDDWGRCLTRGHKNPFSVGAGTLTAKPSYRKTSLEPKHQQNIIPIYQKNKNVSPSLL